MTTVSEELILLERVFLKVGTVDTDEDLEGCLAKILPHVISKLSSPSEEVRTKVIELLTHVNKRVKSRGCVQLPVETLLNQYQDPTASAFVINFAIIYIKLGFPRLPSEKRVELLESLVKAAEVKKVQHRETLLYILIGSLHLAKIPNDSKTYLSLHQCPTVLKLLLDIIQNIILYPYGWKGEDHPPELSQMVYSQLLSNLPEVTKSEQLEVLKMTCLKLLTSGVYDDRRMFPILATASADPRSSVFSLAEMFLRKISGGLELDKTAIHPLYSVYMGGGDGDKKRGPASTRIRLKILPCMTKSDYIPWPICIQVLFDSLYGENTNLKLCALALNYCDHIIKKLSDNQLEQVCSVLLKSGLMQLVKSEWAKPSLIRQAFTCIGLLVSRCPQLASNTLLDNLFTALMQERDIDVSMALRDCLVAMAPAFSNQGDEEWLHTLVSNALSSRSAKARSAALHYLTSPAEKSTKTIYTLLNVADHVDDDIAVESKKSLYGPNYKLKQIGEGMKFAEFDSLLSMLLEKEATKPPVPRLHSEMVFYLRLCLAKASDCNVSLDQLEHPCEGSTKIASYLELLCDSQPSLIPRYVTWLLNIINKDVGVVACYALVEILGCLPGIVRPLVQGNIDRLMGHIGHAKEEVRQAVAQLISLGCRDDALSSLLSEVLTASAATSNVEKAHGSMLAAGYIYARAASSNAQPMVHPAPNLFNNLVTNLTHAQSMIVSGSCQSLALVARVKPLPISLQEKETVADTLINIVMQQKYTSKIKDYACVVLGNLSIGEDFPHKEKIVKYFLEHSNEIKEVELVLSVGELLVSSILGDSGANGLDPWTQREKPGGTVTKMERVSEMGQMVTNMLTALVFKPHPNTRQCACFWLLAIVKNCSHLDIIKSKLQDIQNGFMELLSDSSSLVQEAAGRGLAIVYQSGSGSVDKSQLLSKLVDQLMSGKRSVNLVTSDTKLFEEGSLGKSPTGGSLSTYKELCSLASDLNKPDLIYKFMSLANHNAVWNSKKGAAFGVSTLVDLAGSEMEAHLPKIIAKLYRYQYDPTPNIQQTMSGIWSAFTSNIPNAVEKYSKEIYVDLVSNIVCPQWRVRLSSCKALSDFMRSPGSTNAIFNDCLDKMAELWTQLFRVMDDVHEQTREAATSTTKTLSRICMRQCDKGNDASNKLVQIILPVIMEKGIKSNVSQVRSVSVSALSDLVKIGVLGDQVVKLVPALLIAAQELESSTLQHISVMVSGSQTDQEAIDSIRASAIKSHFTVQTLTRCVDYIKLEMLDELVPQLADLLKSSVGLGTRLATCHFITLLVHAHPTDKIQPYIGKLLGALLSGLTDRNSAIRKQYSATIGQLCKHAKSSSLDKIISKLKQLYFDKEDDSIRLTVGMTFQAMLSHAQENVKNRASAILPLAFFAKHVMKQKDGGSDKMIEVWDEVSDDVGGNSGIVTHNAAIAELLISCLSSPSWNIKAQAGRSITSLANKTGEALPTEVRTRLVTSVVTAVSGRTWDNKHYLLHALAALAKNNSNDIECTLILETIEKECNREKLDYKVEALRTLGDVLSTLNVNRFREVHKLVMMIVNADRDGDEDKAAASDLVEVAYQTLGKAWPNHRPTQDAMWEGVLSECVTRLEKVPRNTQAVLLSTVEQVIERLSLLKENSLPPQASKCIDLCIQALDYALGISKHTNLRKVALNLLLLLLERTQSKAPADYNKIVGIYTKYREQLDVDTSSEVRSRMANIKESFALS